LALQEAFKSTVAMWPASVTMWASVLLLSGLQAEQTCEEDLQSLASEDEALKLLQQKAKKVSEEEQEDNDLLDPVEGFATVGLMETGRLDGRPNKGDVPGDGMTMWSETEQSMVGSACQYANAGQGGLKSPAAQTPLIQAEKVCAANYKMFEGGFACGRCYKISFNGEASTDPGRPGSEIIQVVDSGAWRNFDCIMPAFKKITGASTGVFQIHYKQVDCPVAHGGPTVTVTASSYYFVSVVFSNLPSPARHASISIDGKSKDMVYLHSAVFQVYTGSHSAASFHIELENAQSVSFHNCFQKLPMNPGSHCNTHGQSSEGSGSEGYSTTGAPQDRVHCCSRCSKFCSPVSGACHDQKSKDYYQTCGQQDHQHQHQASHDHSAPAAPASSNCLNRYDQCGGTRAANSDWYPGSGLQCCGTDQRGPLSCNHVNKWLSQCL